MTHFIAEIFISFPEVPFKNGVLRIFTSLQMHSYFTLKSGVERNFHYILIITINMTHFIAEIFISFPEVPFKNGVLRIFTSLHMHSYFTLKSGVERNFHYILIITINMTHFIAEIFIKVPEITFIYGVFLNVTPLQMHSYFTLKSGVERNFHYILIITINMTHFIAEIFI